MQDKVKRLSRNIEQKEQGQKACGEKKCKRTRTAERTNQYLSKKSSSNREKRKIIKII